MEFLNTPASLCDPSCMVKIDGEYIDRFNWLSDPQHIRRVHEVLRNDKYALEILELMYKNGITGMKEQVNQFIACNFAAMDHLEDITEEGAINPEYVHCPHKGANRACPHGSEKPYCIRCTKMDIPVR